MTWKATSRVLLIIVQIVLSSSQEHDGQCLTVGSTCFEGDAVWPMPDCNDKEWFLTCKNGFIIRSICPIVRGQQRTFAPQYKLCLQTSEHDEEQKVDENRRRSKRQVGVVGSGQAGAACIFNTDCLIGMYCNSGLCTCQSTYIQIQFQCYPQVNPGQTQCTYTAQCSAVWPGATCGTQSAGQCSCPTDPYATTGIQYMRAVQTRDGYVCVPTSTQASQLGTCPLPYYGATLGLLDEFDTPGALVITLTCKYASTTTQCASIFGNTPYDDLYDCIPDVASVGSATSDTNNGHCCPNRAYTCSLQQIPALTGTGTLETRYSYNPATGTCSSFQFNSNNGFPLAGNANNFQTLAHCLSYCGNSCPRGIPQYTTTTGTSIQQQTRITCTSSSSTCTSTNYQCTTVSSSSYCCPKPSFICSQFGGISVIPADQTAGYSGGKPGCFVSLNNGAPYAYRIDAVPGFSTSRWYYNTVTSTCMPFTFKGLGGNFNNFFSQSDCQKFCNQLLCTQGSPLTDGNGNILSCTSNGCPSTYTCSSNVCCPTRQTVCSEPKQAGTCTTYTTAYWYNAQTKQCEQFTYSGCQGNDNNFASQTTCQTYCQAAQSEPQCVQGQAYQVGGRYITCGQSGSLYTSCPTNYECDYDGFNYACCPTQTYTCSITYNTGTSCGTATTRWYFSPTTVSCQTFQYNGCDGNSNNFATQQACQLYCNVGGCPNGGQPYQEVTGSLRVCQTSITCPSQYTCSAIQISTQSVVNYCCPTRAYICSLPPSVGQQCVGTTATSSYYYNSAMQGCTSFSFSGCNGNGNNFATLAACQNFCNAAACATGENVYYDPNTLLVYNCNPSQATSCPSGFTCKYDSLGQRSVCCGGQVGGVCPTGERVYSNPTTGAVQTCYPNNANTCPTNYLCRFNVNVNTYYCCRPVAGSYCKTGYAAYLNPIGNTVQSCIVGNLVNNCPQGYSCQGTAQGSIQGYCCSTSLTCPSGTVYTRSDGTMQACTLGGFGTGCPIGYTCQTTAGVTTALNGYCCSTGSSLCPSGVAYQPSGTPVSCNPSVSTCPTGYSCQLSAQTNTSSASYFCCSSTTIASSLFCPTGYTVYAPAGSPIVCNPSVNTCPSGYQCANNPSSPSTYYCCQLSSTSVATTTVCPSNYFPYQPSGSPVPCAASQPTSCPPGYQCLASLTNPASLYCCTAAYGAPVGTACPPNSTPYQPAGVPTVCIPNQSTSTCPTGYQCTLSAATSSTYVCCSAGTTTSSVCSSGTAPYQPLTACSLTANTCPAGFACQQSTSPGSFVCCSISSSTSSVCSSGAAPYQPLTACSLTVSTCPAGYTCQQSTSVGSFICCSIQSISPTNSLASNAGCPPGQSAIPAGSTFQQCSPFQSGSCPAAYSCQYSTTINQYVCCGSGGIQSVVSGNCPVGTAPLMLSTGVPQSCVNGACPAGYACSGSLCCTFVSSSTIVTNVVQNPSFCPGGGQPATLPGSASAIQNCQPGAILSGCPSGYSCQQSPSGQYYCCIGGTVTQPQPVCPSGNMYLYPGTNLPLTCNSFSLNQCPAGYACTSTSSGSVCCSTLGGGIIGESFRGRFMGTNSDPHGCPSGSSYITPDSRTPHSCNAAASLGQLGSCPLGYVCTFIPSLFRYQCCSGDSRREEPAWNRSQPGGWSSEETQGRNSALQQSCPSGSLFVYPGSNLPLVCRGVSGSECPFGYTCTWTQNGPFCCSSSDGHHETAAAFPGSSSGPIGRVAPSASGDPFGCPTGSSYIPHGADAPWQNCDRASSFGQHWSCPIGYSCTFVPTTSRYQCCSNTNREEQPWNTFKNGLNQNAAGTKVSPGSVEFLRGGRNGPCYSNEVACFGTCAGQPCVKPCLLACPNGCMSVRGVCVSTSTIDSWSIARSIYGDAPDGTAIARGILKDRCSHTANCSVPHSVCLHNRCQCEADYTATSNEKCIRRKLR